MAGTLGLAGPVAHPPAVEARGGEGKGGEGGSGGGGEGPGSRRVAAVPPRPSPSGGMPRRWGRSMVTLHGREGTMPDKLMRLRRNEAAADTRRPVMLAIAGDSAAGKTTLT